MHWNFIYGVTLWIWIISCGTLRLFLGRGEVKTLQGAPAKELRLTPFILLPNGELFREHWPRLQLDVSIALCKSALRVNTCTQPETMKDVDLNSSAHWRRFPAFPGTLSMPCSPRKTVVRKTEGYSLCFSSLHIKLVVPNCLTLVGVLTFHYGNWIFLWSSLNTDLLVWQIISQAAARCFLSLSVCACTANSVLPSCTQNLRPLKQPPKK